MKNIKIPFRAMFQEAMLTGKKTCTLRTKKYGQAGDTFEVFGTAFELIAVCPTTDRLGINYLYRLEGFNQPGELWKVWDKIHPRLDRDSVVFAHFFKKSELKEMFK